MNQEKSQPDQSPPEVETYSAQHGVEVEIPEAPEGCTPLKITRDGQVTTGMMCLGRSPRRTCSSCAKLVHTIFLCDHPTEKICKKCKGKTEAHGFHTCHWCSGTGKEPCSRKVCVRCTASNKEPGVNRKDYCTLHRTEHGFAPLVWKEKCYWMLKAKHSGTCLHKGCGREVIAGERCLIFPDRQRAMCIPCGERYLEIATVREK